MADKLQGIWIFHDDIAKKNKSDTSEKTWYFDFVSEGLQFNGMLIGGEIDQLATNRNTHRLHYYSDEGDKTLIFQAAWTDYNYGKYKTIQILSTYDEVENAAELVAALSLRATFIPVEGAMQIPLTSPSGIKLKTSGKTCQNDIIVAPVLEDKEITANGTYYPDVTGFRQVHVAVQASGDDISKYFEAQYADVGLPTLAKLKAYAFYSDTVLKTIDISSATSIGGYALNSCTNLTTVDMSSATRIGSSALRGCSKLTTVDMRSVKTIDSNVFYGCTNLTTVNMGNSVTNIGNSAFYQCKNLALTSLPESVTSISASAFYQCSVMALTSLPKDLTTINRQVFSGCYELAITSLPNGLTSIGQEGFKDCRKLAITSIPEGVTSIGMSAFSKCTGLTSITFKGTPTTIDSTAFGSCTNLTTINVPWAEGAVANAPWGATNATVNYNYTGG